MQHLMQPLLALVRAVDAVHGSDFIATKLQKKKPTKQNKTKQNTIKTVRNWRVEKLFRTPCTQEARKSAELYGLVRGQIPVLLYVMVEWGFASCQIEYKFS